MSLSPGKDVENGLATFVESGADWERLNTGFGFTEGPSWHSEGYLVFSDILCNRLHRWDPERKAWSAEPAAFTQSIVTPRKMINGVLFALAGPEDRNRLNPTGETLQPGKVQLRVYLDRDEAIAESPAVLLNDREPDATAMIDAAFGKGFKNADMVEGAQLSIRGD